MTIVVALLLMLLSWCQHVPTLHQLLQLSLLFLQLLLVLHLQPLNFADLAEL